ncbi:CIA30 family protein [Mariniflexile maritimum]|uniref:CIA30 family protein n=1 Tax=Mariniflexile maritimum TaxID=2682493 RepID=UPI0012F6397E|nr:CIA30 family protein [Mariniflexile maritimum]
MILFKFKHNSNISDWKIVDDVVMGGCSSGNFGLNEAGNGIFSGVVSLDNNGGFSMVQYYFGTKSVAIFSKVCIRLKGDGKTYQFRIKANKDDKHSYIALINTSNDWETLEIPFNTMYPAFRGKPLNLQNYHGLKMEAIAFLIGNKIDEYFKLEIDSIELK